MSKKSNEVVSLDDSSDSDDSQKNDDINKISNLSINLSEVWFMDKYEINYFFNEDNDVSYLTPQEKILLNYYRTLPEKTASAVINLCEKLSQQ